MSWPDYDSSWNPYFGDEITYGRELGRVSPEGNLYGQTRFIREWVHPVWWTGVEWRDIVITGQVDLVDELPTDRRPFGEVWHVRVYDAEENTYILKEYFYNSEYPDDPWRALKWLWDVDALSDLPVPGIRVGAAHMVREEDVLVYWNGYQWRRLAHAGLRDDEPERHLPPGFLDLLIPDVKLVYVNQYELTLEAVEGGTGIVFVGGDKITASPATAVFSNLAALNLIAGVLVEADLVADTEYWVYLANTKSSAFNQGTWDYRGKLFLSTTTPIDGYLGSGIGKNARLAGRIQTDEDGYFARELDISLISNRASIIDAFREYSDFVLDFIDESTLRLRKLDGAYGQIFIPDSLRYIGFDYDIERTDDWVKWDSDIEGYVSLESTSLASNTVYYIYFAGMVDAFNFNEINPRTGRPWQESDLEAEDNYVSVADLRIKPFLSPKIPDHGRMSETWPGFYTRHIGQVVTDDNGKFINSRDLSNIRQPTLNPTYFDGLAEITFYYMGETEFRVGRIKGTSGIVNVGGEAVQTYDVNDSEYVHQALNSAIVQAYNEASPTDPLSDLSPVSTYTSQTLYLYLANSRSFWNEYASGVFFSTTAPSGGYLSHNWPGNQARWIASVRINAAGKFTGSYLEDATRPPTLLIDDSAISLNVVWSSAKITGEFNKVYLAISAQSAFENQKTQGCAVRLEYADTGTIRLYPQTTDVTVVFPDLTYLAIPEEGLSFNVASSSAAWGTMYYVYLNIGGLYLSTSAPDNVYDALETLGTDSILIGYMTTGGMIEAFDDITFSDSSDFIRRNRRGDITNWVRDSESKGHFTDGTNPEVLTGTLVRVYHSVEIDGTAYTIINIVDDGEGTDEVWLDADAPSGTVSGIYGEIVANGLLKAAGVYEADGSSNPSTDYATADMTSNTTPSPNVCYAEYTPTDAYKVFDRDEDTACYAGTGQDIYFDFGDGNSACINKWAIQYGYWLGATLTYITGAKIYGSNVAYPGSEDWDLLDTKTFGSPGGSKNWSSYRTFTNSMWYRHYRFEVTSVNGSYTYLYALKLINASFMSDTDIVACCSAASLQQDASSWSHVSDILMSSSIPDGAAAYCAFSWDDEATWWTIASDTWTQIVKYDSVWKYWDGASWQAASEDFMIVALEEAMRDSDNQFSIEDLADLIEDDWNDTGGFDPSDDYFDFAIALKPDSDAGTPEISEITGKYREGHKHLAGVWNVYSFWSEPNREWYETIIDFLDDDEFTSEVIVDLPGFFIPPNHEGELSRTGSTGARAHLWYSGSHLYCSTNPVTIGEESCEPGGKGELTLTVSKNPTSLSTGVSYLLMRLPHTKELIVYPSDFWKQENSESWYENVSGVFKVTRTGTS